MNNYIPHDIVLEILGNVSFSKNQEHDVQIAESIAGNSYSSMASLFSTIEGCISSAKELKAFKKFQKEAQREPFFKEYFPA